MDQKHELSFAATLELIRTRRTNLRMDASTPLPIGLLEELCTAATWAPNHKRTNPWRFAVITGPARRHLGELVAQQQQADGVDDAAVLTKSRTKYERGAAIIVVASHSDPGAAATTRAEDRDAVSAGVQNLLLAATAAGINSYWGTGLVTGVPAVKRWCGLDPNDTIIAVIYLGQPVGGVPDPGRAPASITHLA